jgi:hypothetical protein
MSWRTRRPSPSMVVSLVALFVALTGVSYAALGKNTVKSKQIKNGTVSSVDVKDDALTGTDINESTLTGLPTSPLADGSVTTPKLADGGVTVAKLGDNAVGTAKLTDNAVNAAKLADSAADSGAIADGAVGTAKLATDAVDAAKLANDAVDTLALQVNSVDTAALQPDAVTGSKTNEPTLDIPTAWANISDPTAAADPDVAAGEGVIDVDDGAFNADGLYCFDLGFTPDLIIATDAATGNARVLTAQASPDPGGSCGPTTREAAVFGNDLYTTHPALGGDMYVAFFDLQ